MRYRQWIAHGLAHALLADADRPGGHSAAALRARAAQALGDNPAWLGAFSEALARLSGATWQRSELHTLAERIAALPELDAAFKAGVPRIRHLILRPARMRPAPLGLDGCALPSLPTAEALADWLGLSLAQLDWLAGDAQTWREDAAAHGRQPARHYRSRLLPKRRGGHRLLEVPKAELKAVQRRILDGLLQRVPVHEAAHGFVAGRSPLSHAQVHAGQPVVIGLDLREFFASVRAARVHALWRTLGYPRGVSRLLTRLVTTRTPPAVLQRLRDEGALDWRAAKRLAASHLPQGAPTSPALANLCAFPLDLRLDGLAHAFGARYGRYADDLCFSGPDTLRRDARSLTAWVEAIASHEGFALHPGKTRIAPQHRQQRVTGLVVNLQPQAPREAFDRLKAILHAACATAPAATTARRCPTSAPTCSAASPGSGNRTRAARPG